MSDDKNNRGPADRSRINVHEDYELRYWSDKFGCTHDQLKAAVKAVGVMAVDVEAYLKKKK
ncbi:DUF3606 domain-containing protein [Caballeronia sp. TF1N1]|uniref:DUF3606 domain-containing protein n=1 Tax=Caballeronia sp. TF1N1 TaxID=2878153 RepID=UPI001FD4CA73|nr:DUF3606 domain-containing protein [Caballeronia sp. TF1N1]